jgi:hypothetical protein
MIRILLAVLLLPGLVYASDQAEEDIWAPFEFFIGEWTGTGEGKSGESKIEVQFRLVLNRQFLMVKHHSEFKPPEEGPKGETHEDIGYISYDHARNKFVFRQFHIEGFVNQYVLDSLSADGRVMVFESEAVENGPPGLRARLTHEIIGEDEYRSAFELAGSDGNFTCYIENRLRRKARP